MIQIYTTPTCKYCHTAMAFLAERNIKFEEINVSSNAEAHAKMVEISGRKQVPVLVFNDGENNIMVGWNEGHARNVLKMPFDASIVDAAAVAQQ